MQFEISRSAEPNPSCTVFLRNSALQLHSGLIGGNMAAWSGFFRPVTRIFLRQTEKSAKAIVQTGAIRCMSEKRTIPMVPSSWPWQKTKDLAHFYFMLGAIPWTIIILYINIYIGPATLEETPEGYEPEHWEYYPHPISRFLARYVMNSPQQEYEKNMAYLEMQWRKSQAMDLDAKVERSMANNRDYNGYFYRAFFGGKYIYDFRMKLDEGLI